MESTPESECKEQKLAEEGYCQVDLW